MPAVSGTWDTHSEAWGDASAVYSKKVPILSFGVGFYSAESGVNIGGSPLIVSLERVDLTITGRDRAGLLKSDPGVVKKINGIWPIISGTLNDVVQVSAGYRDNIKSGITWEGPRSFIIGVDDFIDFTYVEGKYIAVKFESVGMSPWRLLGYDLDLELVGER